MKKIMLLLNFIFISNLLLIFSFILLKINSTMKIKFTLLSLLISITQISSAQIGIENNAKWYFNWDNQFEFGTIKTDYVSDTIISGLTAKKFISKKYTFVGNPNGIYSFVDSSEVRVDFTTSNQDSVFWWDGTSFQLILDYSTQVGDSRSSIPFDNSSYPFCDSLSTFETVSTSLLYLNQNYRTITLSSPYSSHYRLNGKHNERIGAYSSYGSYSWLFPTLGWCTNGDPMQNPEEVVIYQFQCFEDDSMFYSPSGAECNYYLNHLALKEKSIEQFAVYPQPFSQTITIDFKQEQSEKLTYKVHNLHGKLVAEGDISQKNATISLTFLENGVYTLSILDARNTLLSHNKLIKQD